MEELDPMKTHVLIVLVLVKNLEQGHSTDKYYYIVWWDIIIPRDVKLVNKEKTGGRNIQQAFRFLA